MPHSKEYDHDVVLIGATGYTGKLVAAHLLQAGQGARLALAGRNRDKLERLRMQLSAHDLPILLGDVQDEAFLAKLAESTAVVCSTVGPYARLGGPLVAACARAGTNYCDLTGEVHWIRHMIDAHEGTAKQSGAHLVHGCGFDSIPSDLGTLFLQEQAKRVFGEPCEAVHAYLKRTKGGVSGGTLASMQGVLTDAASDPQVRQVLLEPYSLNPPGEQSGPDRGDQLTVERDPDVGWTAPYLMAAPNSRIVRRSNALMGYPYGRNFRYKEAVATGPGIKGLAAASAITTASAGLFATMAAPPLHALANRFLPQPGSGPSSAQRESGHFTYELIGHHGEQRLVVRVESDRDPGYGSTALMLAESALCLATDPQPVAGGSWTPASAMGMRLVERLNAVGIRFSLDENSLPGRSGA